MHCQFVPHMVHSTSQTLRSRQRHSHNAQGVFYASFQHFFVVVLNTYFSFHRSSRELSTARATPTLPLCLSQSPGSKLLGGEDSPDGYPRKILACWGQLQASGLQRFVACPTFIFCVVLFVVVLSAS